MSADELATTRALLEASIAQLSDTTRASHPSEVSRLPGPPSAKLLAQYKTLNFPAIFTDAFAAWPAHEKWSAAYFDKVMGSDQVTVAVTPHGNADSITEGMFVMPHEEQTSMSEMMAWLRQPEGNVRYLQLQNGSLHIEFKKLAGDVDAYGPVWARDAFALINHGSPLPSPTPSPPLANAERESTNQEGPPSREEYVRECGSGDCLGNIWIGNHLSKTSLHHDPYENIYVQIRGAKKFTLFPPCEYHWLHEQRYKPAKYVPSDKDDGGLRIEPIGSHVDGLSESALEVPWLSGPRPDSEGKRTAQGMQVTLQAGETLYLPALWFHSVEQIDDAEGLCIALNYWYDLDYNSDLWRNWKFIRKTSLLAQGKLDECRRELADEEDL